MLESEITLLNPRWRTAMIALAMSLVVLVVAFWGTFLSIVGIWWRSGTFTHGFFVVPIVAYLVWGKRQELSACEPRPTALGVAPLLLLLSMLWLVAHVGNVIGVQQLAVVTMIPLLVWAVLGLQVVRVLAFPLGYLMFAVPFGEFLVPMLQDFTAAFAVKALELFGIPVYLEGRFFYIPSGTFEVAAACSGVRYLIASLALGVLYAYLTYYTAWRRLVFVLLSIVVPILANGLRAFGIVMIADLSNYELAVGVDHLVYGWLFFGIVMLFLFWLGSLFRERAPKPPTPPPNGVAEPQRPLVLKNMLPVGLALLLLPTGPLVAAWLDQTVKPVSGSLKLPAGVDGWDGPFPVERPVGATYRGADAQIAGQYRRGGYTVQLFAAYYAFQRQGSELISSENMAYSFPWRLTGEQQVHIALPNGQEWPLHATQLTSDGTDRLVWHWYTVGDRVTAEPIMAKLYEVQVRLRGAHPGSAVVVLAADDQAGSGPASEALREFMTTMLPAIQTMIGTVQ